MIASLRTKLSLSYVLVALIVVLLISALTYVFVQRHFIEYVKQNQELKNKEIVSTLSRQFKENGKWDVAVIETIGVSYLENGIIIDIKDNRGNTIWNAKEHNNGMCLRIIENMANNASTQYGNTKGGYTEFSYSIKHDLTKVGVVQIGTSSYLNEHDLAFISTMNTVLIGVGIFSLLFALVLGTLMARRLSSPISRVIGAAKSIANGLYSDRISEKSNTSEINQLTLTINNLADSMEKQELLRKRLTSDVAHELRTPIATLQSHMEAMIDGIWKPDIDRLKSCHEEIIRIGKMVGDLDKLAKFESENLVLNKELFDISELTKRLIQNFESDFLNKSLEINFTGSKEEIFADKDKVSQVVVNLLSNALKYTPEGGKVNVNVKGTEEITQFVVKDNGPGIPKEDLPYIFERFYRADKSRNRLTGGSGIGLTIIKAIVEAHGGNVDVNSSREYGSEFIVSFPKNVG
jgi:two-component system, OmpR family, sensor histidine kinase BaeS